MDCLLSIKNLLVMFVTTFLFYSCCSVKNYDYKHIECQEIPNEAVNIAISDYSKRLRKRKDINNVTAVKVYIGNTSTDWFYIATKPWRSFIDDESGKYYFTDRFDIELLDEYIGKIPPLRIPTQFVEKDDVLYVWHDPQAVLTENLKNVLIKYNLVYYPGDEMIVVTTDGGDFSYIFCKTNYKRRYYRRIIAHYATPLPSCGCGKGKDNK